MPTPTEPPLVASRTDGTRRTVHVPSARCDHVRFSTEMILEAAAAAAPGRAVVLGAGHCREVPVASLAARFPSLTLNDHDASALNEGLAGANLPPDRAASVRTVVADLTGVTRTFLERVDGCLRGPEGATPERAAEAMALAAKGVEPVPFSTGERYHLVVASCVLCQLHLAALNLASARFAEAFPGREAVLSRSRVWVDAVYGLARRMEDTFVTAVHALTEPGGRIYLSDTVQCAFIRDDPGGGWLTEGLYRMTRTPALADYLDGRFRVERAGRWLWVMEPSGQPGGVGRLYRVQGLVLSTRAEPPLQN